MRDAEFGHAPIDCGRLPAADHGDVDSGIDQLANTKSILRIERLGFDSVIRQIESAIGEYAVDVERDQAYPG
jgi:hypothetical protein